MKKLINIILLFILLVFCIMNCWLVRDLEDKTTQLIECYNIEPEIIFVDSLVYDSVYIEKTEIIRLPIYNTDTIITTDTLTLVEIDSVDVVLPIEVKHFQDTLAETAFLFNVQGYNCRVTDFYVENLMSCPDQEKPLKTNRFGLGLQLGIGVNEKGFTHYIGIGLNYNIFSF